MEEIQLQSVAGTHGDQFEARIGGTVAGIVGWRQLSELTEHQLGRRAQSSIALKDGTRLAVYELRTQFGAAGSEDALQIEIGGARIRLSQREAHDLACVLLAYSGLENKRGQWLVRLESAQR